MTKAQSTTQLTILLDDENGTIEELMNKVASCYGIEPDLVSSAVVNLLKDPEKLKELSKLI